MAGASLLTLLDDIASMLDDVSAMTKIAARNTAGVLGDDLALNAQQVTGFSADRELPVVWRVAKGSAVNKAILVPSALVISAVAPPLVIVLLMVGGAYLCFEGFEKVWHKLTHRARGDAHGHDAARDHAAPAFDGTPAELESLRVKGAVRTDFVLSAEIIVITLGTVAAAAFAERLLVLVAISAIMTVGVYGLVAGIVKIDDVGLYLRATKGDSASARLRRSLGWGLLAGAPWLMKSLGILGTVAMFLVGGGIFVHNIPALHHMAQGLKTAVEQGAGQLVATLVGAGFTGLVGVLVGAIAVAMLAGLQRVRRKPAKA